MAKTSEWNGYAWETIEDDPQTGGLFIRTEQNVKPALDWAKKQRNSGVNDLGGAKDGHDLKHYATISHGQILAMRDKGIDIWDKNCTKDLIKEIETNYPLCKVTNRKL